MTACDVLAGSRRSAYFTSRFKVESKVRAARGCSPGFFAPHAEEWSNMAFRRRHRAHGTCGALFKIDSETHAANPPRHRRGGRPGGRTGRHRLLLRVAQVSYASEISLNSPLRIKVARVLSGWNMRERACVRFLEVGVGRRRGRRPSTSVYLALAGAITKPLRFESAAGSSWGSGRFFLRASPGTWPAGTQPAA